MFENSALVPWSKTNCSFLIIIEVHIPWCLCHTHKLCRVWLKANWQMFVCSLNLVSTVSFLWFPTDGSNKSGVRYQIKALGTIFCLQQLFQQGSTLIFSPSFLSHSFVLAWPLWVISSCGTDYYHFLYRPHIMKQSLEIQSQQLIRMKTSSWNNLRQEFLIYYFPPKQNLLPL